MPFDCHHFESKSVLYVTHNAQEVVYRALQVSNDTSPALPRQYSWFSITLMTLGVSYC